MKNRLNYCVIFAVSIGLYCSTIDASTSDNKSIYTLDLYDLLKIKVTSASKHTEPLRDAPSVVTVYTRQQIKKDGLKSLDEVFKRVPGFFLARNREWQILGSRGISTQTNKQYLLLIDGHSNNSIIFTGFHNELEFLTLDKVERVEIIRGPGSTLWGSDAVMGVINVITRNGSDINGAELNTDHHQYFTVNNKPRATEADSIADTGGNADITDYRNGLNRSINFTAGKSYEDIAEAMFSFTYFDGEGYELDTEGPRLPGFDKLASKEDWNESWEMYAKARVGEIHIRARGVYANELDYRSDTDKQYYRENRDAIIEDEWKYFWVEGEYEKTYSDSMKLETKIYGDTIYQNKPPKGGDTSRVLESDRLYEENKIGLDLVLTKNYTEHMLKIGGQVTSTNIGPMIQASLIYDPEITGNYVTEDGRQYYRAPFAQDKSYGIFVEDAWKYNKSLSLVVGLRADYNDLREKTTRFLPRFAAIYDVSDTTVLKYLFNTGYRRPSYWESIRTSTGLENSTRSEEITQQDLQILKSYDKGSMGITAYYIELEDYIDWISTQGNGNIADVTSYGLELEFNFSLGSKLDIYGNASWNENSAVGPETFYNMQQINPDDEIIGMPRYTYNIGCDINISNSLSTNVHIRGWSKLPEYNLVKYASSYGERSGAQYLDLNILYRNMLISSLHGSLYAHNVLNNDAMISENFKGGAVASEPLSVGFKLSYHF